MTITIFRETTIKGDSLNALHQFSPSRTFRNRIAKSIGVLVAAALIATLGLPGAAQAQSIDPIVELRRWRRLRGHVGGSAPYLRPDNWIVMLTRPDGTKVVIDRTSDGVDNRLA